MLLRCVRPKYSSSAAASAGNGATPSAPLGWTEFLTGTGQARDATRGKLLAR